MLYLYQIYSSLLIILIYEKFLIKEEKLTIVETKREDPNLYDVRK